MSIQGEVYTGNVIGYKTKNHCQRTNNPIYNSIIEKIAVLEIKKIILTRMSSADTFISKETTKCNYSTGRTFLKDGEKIEKP